MDEIRQKKSEILKYLGLSGCTQQMKPVQEFIYPLLSGQKNLKPSEASKPKESEA